MKVITVIPLSRSKVSPELSYFTAADAPIGAIVSVPLRSKQIHAIVSGSREAGDIKMEIKNAPFEIRKLAKVRASAFFPPVFMESARELSAYYATNDGTIIDSLISDSILENAADLPPPLPAQPALPAMETNGAKSGSSYTLGPGTVATGTYAVQGDDSDRSSTWRSLVRQEFARKRSIAIYAPTAEDAEQIYSSLEKGIEGYIFILHSRLSPKKTAETWTKLSSIDHPIVVVATSSFALLPRGDIDTVIIERENSRGWIGQKAPYIDGRHALETVARKRGQAVFLADCLLRTETLCRLENGEIDQSSPFKWRSISLATDTLVDMKKKVAGRPEFKVISPELADLIRKNSAENTHLFIMATRRGMSSVTACDDCETVVLCRSCSAPVVLHASQATGKNFFMCHKCGERRSADEACANCGGWRLTALGIGIDRVHEELKESFKGIDVVKIDTDTTRTDKQISQALEKFRSRPGTILLGTELALQHLGEKVDHIAIASIDSLFALPDFRIEEKAMYVLIRLRAQATRSILVQTRRADERVFEYGLKGNLSDFYRATIVERKKLGYPPFATLIKITIEGKKDSIAADMAAVQELINPHEIDVFPAFTSTMRGKSVIHGLIKIEPHAWPDPELVSKLRSLGAGISVKVSPESLL